MLATFRWLFWISFQPKLIKKTLVWRFCIKRYCLCRYYNNKKLNGKSDVYSFGVILLELITGCKPVLTKGLEQAMHIIQWVRPMFERRDVENIVDPRIQGTYNTFSAWRAVEIAMVCIASTANNRLDVCNVYHQLKECLDMEKWKISNRQWRDGVRWFNSSYSCWR